jgi:ELWxxDGT repeat protein
MRTDVVARKHRVLLCCLSALLLAAAPRGPAHRVKDINTVPGSGPDPAVPAIVAGNTLYFTVSGALWKSDGTAAGTQPFEGTGAIVGAQFKAVLGDILYFTATDGDHGVEIWRTDGTLEGTGMVRDINPGPADSGIRSLVPFRGELYFGANDGVHGLELWKTDGTKDGTVLVADLNPGSNSSALFSLRASGDRLYFSESSFVCGQSAALYTTDGTASGTRLLRQFVTQGTSSIGFETCFGWPPGDFLSFGGLTYFIASDGISGLQLWRIDGTVRGTALVKDICSGGCNAFSFSDGVLDMGTPLLQVINGRLFFFANDGVHGAEPWTSDGTEAGTRLVKDVFPGPASSTFGYGVTVLGSAFMFPANSSGPGWELWRSDGTEAGTFLAGSAGGALAPNQIIPVGHAVFFTASKGSIRVPDSGSRRLWKTDSAGGPASIVSESILDPTGLVNFGGTLYFAASVSEELALWKTDGTSGGTSVVHVLSRREDSSSSPFPLGDLDGSLLFFATGGKEPSGLWSSDGTKSGTQPVAPVALGGGASGATGVSAPFQGSIFFSGNDGVHGSELWRTDGTPAGTRLVKDIAVNGGTKYPYVQDSNPCGMTVVGDTLYFAAFGGDQGSGLWKSDGTEAGTTFIKDVALDCYSGQKTGLVTVDGLIYFSGLQPPNFYPALWRTDGTSQGTALVKPVTAQNLISFGGRLLFFGFFGSTTLEGSGLWTSDGTSAGTSIVKSFGGYLTPFTRLKDVLLFFAATQDNRIELWRTDGTPGGTTFLADFPFGLVGNGPNGLVSAGDRVFFTGQDAGHGVELWTSDGTPGGTRIVRDVDPRNLTAFGDVLLFSARDPIHGEELWQSDGTEEGTFLVQDISPGPASSSPGNFMKAGPLVYFTADDGESGAELWAMPLSALDSPSRRKPHHVQDVPWRR